MQAEKRPGKGGPPDERGFHTQRMQPDSLEYHLFLLDEIDVGRWCRSLLLWSLLLTCAHASVGQGICSCGRPCDRVIANEVFEGPDPVIREACLSVVTGDTVVIDTGADGACKHAHGRSNIDYLIVDHDVALLIDQVEIVLVAPWQPHVGIAFRTNSRPEHVKTNQILKPKPNLYEKDDKGQEYSMDLQ